MSFFDTPESTEKHSESDCGGGVRYGLSSAQGYRKEMQDDYNAIAGFPQLTNNVSWFAVFDGHGGSNVSKFCAKELIKSLETNEELMKALENEH